MITKNPKRPTRRACLAALLATVALSGCANLGRTPEEVVTQRVEARWDALIKGDYDEAWTYTQPAFRGVVKQRDYAKRFGTAGKWLGIQVHDVTCEAERCSVRLRLSSKLTTSAFRGMDVVTTVDETWVREDGQWWYYQNF